MGRDRFDRKVDLTFDCKADDLRRVEVIRGVGRRRSWPDDFKANVVAESFESRVVISQVARRLCLTPQQLFGWAQSADSGGPGCSNRSGVVCFVVLSPAAPETANSSQDDDRGVIEIVLKGTLVRLRVAVTAKTLAAVLRAVKAFS
jgi:transposase